ncbi:MAG: kly 1, partial [Planctomycetaceae bacterium]|nr:kly 1 [Planctomycetaceae bacterium]
MFRNLFGNAFRSTSRRRPTRSKLAFDTIETLETRLVLFAASGNAWPTSQLITISFEPDGTNLGGVNSDLASKFNGNSNLAGRWQSEILRAAETWSEATNINFVVVSDNGAASGSGKYQQGDPGFGDIRIGGYDFQNTSLARAYMPPTANNFSVAGDIAFNTGIAYGVGQGYDLYSVALHELGHALGLDHTSASSSAAMWSSYNGIKTKLGADDIAGIRSIYSANGSREVDDYDVKTGNNTVGTATDITGKIVKSSASAVVTELDITTSTDVDYYKFTAPRWTDDTVVVSMQASGLSMLSPKLTVYAADQKTVLGTATATTQYGGTVKVTLTGVGNNDVFYIKAEDSGTSAFGVGNYAITVDLGATTTPTATPPKTTMANGATPSSKGGVAEGGGEFDDIISPTPVIQTISPDTGASSTDLTTSSSHIVLSGVAPLLSTVEIYENGHSIGSFLSLLGAWSYSVPGTLADGNYTFMAQGHGLLGLGLLSGGNSDPVTVTIDTKAPVAPSLNLTTGDQATSMTGTSDPSALITIYDNGVVYATTTADGHGNWSLSTAGA